MECGGEKKRGERDKIGNEKLEQGGVGVGGGPSAARGWQKRAGLGRFDGQAAGTTGKNRPFFSSPLWEITGSLT